MEEIREFCSKEFTAVCLFWNFWFSGLLIILLITQKQSMLIATILLILDKMPAVVYHTDS